jgi:hypothetical protein
MIMKNAIALPAAFGLGAALLAAAPAGAQLRTLAYPALTTLSSPAIATATLTASEEDKDTSRTVPDDLQKRIRAMLDNVVPAWDKAMLPEYETPNAWEDNLQYGYLNKLLGETAFAWEGLTQPPPDADRLEDDSKSMRIRRADGAFRYLSRKRVFTPDLKGKGVPAPDYVSRQMENLLGNLGFPMRETGKPDLQTQEMALSGENNEVAERFPVYAFFTLQRQIGGIPVEGSTVRAAVNPRGEVQRLKIAWPHFKIRTGAELRSRERVLEEAFQKVLAQDPTDKMRLASRLVYTRTEKGEFLPAVQVDVSDGETPYRLTVPVAQ